jgi:hypothetical protein
VSRTFTRLSPIAPLRRLFLLAALIAAAFAMTSLGHISPASAQPVDEGIAIDCSLGGGSVPPGTIINLPPAGDLPAITVICGNDGKWHVSAAIVKRNSPRLLAPVTVGPKMQLKK